ncbi:CD99 antigen isoform X1 [Meriones unguiculatus]|uniref:CD99 antigen isoform X1 n=1 Tax=Meriones unguiculatus TaxID=10047 RepID=UPI000B4ECF1F|nr:CD99 antigen isoform X1 [Meriones unguiculatus]
MIFLAGSRSWAWPQLPLLQWAWSQSPLLSSRPHPSLLPSTDSAMACAAPLLPLLLWLLLGDPAGGQGGDFDLSDALDGPKKPTPGTTKAAPKKPAGDLDLKDAMGDGARQRLTSSSSALYPSQGGISDTDLEDVVGKGGRGAGGGGARREDPEAGGGPAQEAVIPGVVAAVLAAVAGAVSSFVAYQRRKLCFRERDSAVV